MKVLHLCAFLACLSSPAMAENVSVVEQVGTWNSVEVDQQGDSSHHKSNILQGGTEQSATVVQRGESTQSASFIEQSGSANGAEVLQDSHEGLVTAKVMQNGNGNRATFNQRNNPGVQISAALDQIGDANEATVLQENLALSGSATTFIRQSGIGNKADTRQRGGSDLLGTISVDQNGEGNVATFLQELTGAVVLGRILQIGDGNVADVGQNMMTTSSAEANISQEGSSNSGDIRQTPGFEGRAISSINQEGVGNRAVTRQEVAFGLAQSTVFENGSGNIVDIGQFGLVGSQLSDISIAGDDNHYTIVQGASGIESHNRSAIIVSGTGNNATIAQQ